MPIFWLATYDHDLAEVNHVAIPGAEGLHMCSRLPAMTLQALR